MSRLLIFLYPVFLSYILYPFYIFIFLFFPFSSQFSFLSLQIPFLFLPSFPSSVINSPACACYDSQKICNPLPSFLCSLLLFLHHASHSSFSTLTPPLLCLSSPLFILPSTFSFSLIFIRTKAAN